MTPDAVLLDLDGTLVDTAPDLVAVLNALLREEGLVRMPYAVARNEVSNGALGLLRLAFGSDLQEPELERLRGRFLEIYQQNLCIHSNIFSGFRDILRLVSGVGIRWGIVTNKPRALTEPLVEALELRPDRDCVVSGDSLPHRKPHPAPLQLAAELLGCAPERCLYIGDARRDIEAGHAAGMVTAAAAWGYIRPAEDPAAWQADMVIRRPGGIAALLDRWPAIIARRAS
jgi:N-acetyl-D-muramate 6-phosphate phosphatase